MDATAPVAAAASIGWNNNNNNIVSPVNLVSVEMKGGERCSVSTCVIGMSLETAFLLARLTASCYY